VVCVCASLTWEVAGFASPAAAGGSVWWVRALRMKRPRASWRSRPATARRALSQLESIVVVVVVFCFVFFCA